MFIVFIKPYAQSVSAQIGILHYKYTKKNEINPQAGEYSIQEIRLEVKELRS